MSSSSSTSPPATAELPAQASQLAVTGGVLIAAAIFLLTAAVFALLLCLYAKRYRGAIPLLSSPSSPRLLIAGSSPIPCRGLAASALRSLPVALHAAAASSAEPLECAVCLSEVGDGEKVRLLPTCGHGFHVGCIDMWFHSHATCPLCRAAVGPAEEKEPHVLPRSEPVPDSATTDEVSDAELPPPVASSLSESARGEEIPQLVIDIPRRAVEGAFPASLTGAGPEDATRSPVSATLKSLTRLLSRGKQGLAGPSCSPRAPTGDIEEGAAVSAALQPKTPKNSPPS